MSHPQWQIHRAEKVDPHCVLSSAARKAIADLSADQFMDRLRRNGEWADALAFAAHGLNKRAAVWLACLCIEHGLGAALTPAQRQALDAVVRWVLQPDEKRRCLARAAADALGLSSPVGRLAYAVSLSGGSMAPPGLPVVPPEPHYTAHFVGETLKAAVGAATIAGGACKAQFVALAVGVARGDYLWDRDLAKGAST